MALFRGPDRETPLPGRCLIGRSRACDLVVAGRDVSGQHAELQWSNDGWQLHDLGSRNGTFLDDVQIAGSERVLLRAGARVRFGREAPAWTLVDASPPQLMAITLADAKWRVAEGGYLALPGPDEPQLAIYEDDGRWVLEQDGATRPVDDRAIVDAGGLWRLHLPVAGEATWAPGDLPPRVAQLRLHFTVSRDEERVVLVATIGGRRIDLQVRAHHYPLLLLARRRLRDRDAGVAEEQAGWLRQDDLKAMLRIDENYFNISIHRARTQLAKAGVADAAALIERRPGTRLLRLGVADFTIATEDP